MSFFSWGKKDKKSKDKKAAPGAVASSPASSNEISKLIFNKFFYFQPEVPIKLRPNQSFNEFKIGGIPIVYNFAPSDKDIMANRWRNSH